MVRHVCANNRGSRGSCGKGTSQKSLMCDDPSHLHGATSLRRHSLLFPETNHVEHNCTLKRLPHPSFFPPILTDRHGWVVFRINPCHLEAAAQKAFAYKCCVRGRAPGGHLHTSGGWGCGKEGGGPRKGEGVVLGVP